MADAIAADRSVRGMGSAGLAGARISSVLLLLLPMLLTLPGLPARVHAQDAAFGVEALFGPDFERREQNPDRPIRARRSVDVVRRWNQIAIDASGLDHTPVSPGEDRVYGEQLGPGRSSRAMAIVHIAIFDAVNAIVGGYESYTGLTRTRRRTSLEAAVAQAAHDTLEALFPSQAEAFDELLGEELRRIRDRKARSRGITVGRQAAERILARVEGDGSDHAEPRIGIDFFPSDVPGYWRPDPISQSPIALGAQWGGVRPFVLQSGSQFRLPPPPSITSEEYAVAHAEVKVLGGDGVGTPTSRTAEQALIGTYWAYDGTPSLCAPPRLYNQIAVTIADRQRTPAVELARLLALVNVAMADTGIAAWDSKYHYQYWRPVVGIRETEPGTGPTGAGDGNDATIGDPAYSPLGAPASNLSGPNFTPPFPAYPSGHAAFGGALFQTLRHFYGTDSIAFTFVSDELNGETRDNEGEIRPLVPRHFETLSQAEEENGQSRIYLGIHWAFDKTSGITQGRNVADYVFGTVFRRATGPAS
jgi:hypothetical protein